MSTMNTVGRPTTPNAVEHDYKHPTLTGGRGLLQDEHLIFESDGWGKTGVDLPAPISAIWCARTRSACRVSASRRRCGTMCG